MRILSLILRPRHLEYAGFANGGAAVMEGAIPSHDRCTDTALLRGMLSRISAEFRRSAGDRPEAVALRVPFGGSEFRKPALAGAEVLDRLEAMTASAPLHIPGAIQLARCCGEEFGPFPRSEPRSGAEDVSQGRPEHGQMSGGAPVVLVFETAFFSALPEREYSYGLDAERMDSMGLRRYGFHGIFHEAASRCLARCARESGVNAPRRILSIVLEPKPEVAAVFGTRPLTVTSGATPLEGIPGETSGGELDAGIVLALSREKGWGPEQINSMLSGESGLLGLTGRRITFEELFNLNEPDLEEAREIIRYRLLLACGAGIAAMSGLDGIVFSGRYAELGRQLGPWLSSRIRLKGNSANPVPWEIFRTSLPRLLADAAVTTVLTHCRMPIAECRMGQEKAQ